MCDFTDKDIQRYKDKIDTLTRYEMCKMWRFAPSGHLYFRGDYPELYDHFAKRLKELGGFTPEISKSLGWEIK